MNINTRTFVGFLVLLAVITLFQASYERNYDCKSPFETEDDKQKGKVSHENSKKPGRPVEAPVATQSDSKCDCGSPASIDVDQSQSKNPKAVLCTTSPSNAPARAPVSPPIANPPQIHPDAQGTSACVREIAAAVRNSNASAAAKDAFALAASLMTDATKNEYMNALANLPLYFNTSEGVRRALLTHSPCNSSQANATVAICAVHSSAGPLLQQWLVHHLGLGVAKIYLMNHQLGTPAYTDATLKPFIDAGYVEIFNYPVSRDTFPQTEIYRHCHDLVKRSHSSFHWLGVIDTDEYWIASKTYNSSISPNETAIADDQVLCLNSYLVPYIDKGAVVFPWRLLSSIGTPFHEYDKLILEQYPREHVETRPSLKSFYNLGYLNDILSPHHSKNFSNGTFAVNIEHRKEDAFIEHLSSKNYLEYAYLRHYWGMSLAENVYFKICGASWERKKFRKARIELLAKMLQEADTAPIALPVPLGYISLLKRLLKPD
jgi:hypothetical protein